MFFQALKMAWSAVLANKMRSFLTMLGIIIGVMSLIILVSIVSSTTDSVTSQISSMGTNLLSATISDDQDKPLKLTDLSAFTESELLDQIAPYGQTDVTAKNGRDSESMTVFGTTNAYLSIQGLELVAGRFIQKSDVDNNTYVVVINQTAAAKLTDSSNPVGSYISLNGRQFLVIGVLAESDSVTASLAADILEAYIPYTTLTKLADHISGITSFCVSAADESQMDAAEAALETMLLERFNQDEEAFSIRNQSTLVETMSSVTDTMAWMLGGIAGISLLVGGIGIMNIMLVSVTERTREIGIRKAIGAKRGSIMLQFLLEALLVSLIGCALGIGMSWGVLGIASAAVADMNFRLSLGVVWVAVGFSATTGVLFGIYPASKAAKKHPIEALRYSG